MTVRDVIPPLGARHLVDSTVWSKARTAGRPDLAEWFNRAVQADLVATCDAVALELLRSARNTAAFVPVAKVIDAWPSAAVAAQ